MYRPLALCLAMFFSGCISQSDSPSGDRDVLPDLGDGLDSGDEGVPDMIADAMPESPCWPAEPAPIAEGDRNLRFQHAAVHPGCTADGQPSLSLSLTQHAACETDDVGPDRLLLFIDALPDAAWPPNPPARIEIAPDSTARGLYFDEQDIAHPVEGSVLIEAFDVRPDFFGVTHGQYTLQSSRGHRLRGSFEADFCAHPSGAPDCFPYDELPPICGVDPEPDVMPEPDVAPPDIAPGDRCVGRYTLTQWVVTELAFGTQYVNDMLASGLIEESIVVDMIVDHDTVQVVHVAPDAAGMRPRSPRVPAYPAMPVDWHEDGGFSTRDPQVFGVWLASSQYPEFEPLVWVLERSHLEATSEDGCATLSITHSGAFVNLNYTVGAQPDVDLDGDGVNDGFSLQSRMTALRL